MHRLLFLILVVAGLSWDVSAAPEPHGKRFRAAGEGAFVPADTAQASDFDASPRELAEMTALLLERAELEELEKGPYAAELSETLGDLARVYEARGLYAEAEQYRERALHLVRVNDGLYSARQGPIVRATLDSLRKRGLYEALDDRYDYFFRLYGAGRPPFDDVRWAATLEYLRWQREAYLREIDRDPRRRLLDLYGEHQDLLDLLVTEDRPADPAKVRDVTLSQLQTLYLVSDREPPRDLTLSARSERVRREDPQDFDLLRERLDNLQRTLRGRGRSIIEEALAMMPESNREIRAELLLALGDWLLWQGASGSAIEAYEEVLAETRGTALEGEARSWFEEPVALPQLEVFSLPLQSGGVSQVVSLTVSDAGRVVEVVSGDARETAELNRLRRYLRAARFRPALRGDEFVAREGWNSRWQLIVD
jgi:hypothetical protein